MTGGRARIVVLDPLHPDAVAEMSREHDVVVRLRPTEEELSGLVTDADALVVRSGVRITGRTVEQAKKLRVVARAGAGTDNIDLVACHEAGVQVFNIPGASAGAVAELALGLTLAVTRNIVRADRRIRQGVWDKTGSAGPELAGRTLGVVGVGRIGSRVTEWGRALGMRVLASVARPSPRRDEELRGRGVTRLPLTELLATADVVCLTVPLTEETRGLLSTGEFATMGPESYLVNVSRGGVVDEEALHEALRSGTIAGAALDVHSVEQGTSALAALDNVVLTPHIGATTTDAQRTVGQILVGELRTALAGGSAEGRVV
ncbi:hydroxyacid dehydrogenase [Streptomyces arenae]|uniref:hydroxyacid dehydrogenase n=1 Tax=Streptomyces arenae TaxID=29301 RepID=UPI00265A3CC1|nr:hydroxyacid dehydrogenase [Streptomyces arenae]MCG7206618.1 hydroxyacid dehydrogenase [Streptomyces arenae]